MNNEIGIYGPLPGFIPDIGFAKAFSTSNERRHNEPWQIHYWCFLRNSITDILTFLRSSYPLWRAGWKYFLFIPFYKENKFSVKSNFRVARSLSLSDVAGCDDAGVEIKLWSTLAFYLIKVARNALSTVLQTWLTLKRHREVLLEALSFLIFLIYGIWLVLSALKTP